MTIIEILAQQSYVCWNNDGRVTEQKLDWILRYSGGGAMSLFALL